MDSLIYRALVELIQGLAVLMVIAYVMTRIPSFGDLLNRRLSLTHRVILGLVFGLMSIFGTLSSVDIFGG
ncbi:MAG TPA: hypothetical protein PKX47_07935, partial [Smithellaceae bacterium]|nr:hypothetical protein [Smithellaceae bacterium]